MPKIYLQIPRAAERHCGRLIIPDHPDAAKLGSGPSWIIVNCLSNQAKPETRPT